MGFLDDLTDKAAEFGEKAKEGFAAAKDKAADLVGDIKEQRFDNDDETSAEVARTAAGHTPETVGGRSYGLDDAVAESTATGGASAAGVTEDPVVDPLDPAVEAVDPMVEPVEPVHVTEDPLEQAPEIRPAERPAVTEDPLEPAPDRTV